MNAIVMSEYGGPEVLHIDEVPEPVPKDDELLIKVEATALNRADILQRRGLYPPPEGASPILGLEMAGIVEAIGKAVTGWRPGDRVCALLPGGGYAEKAVIPAAMAIPVPDRLTTLQAAAIPEVFLTAYMNLVWLGQLQEGQDVLIHAGASGVGTAAIQLVREMGARAFVTAGSSQKLAKCMELGAESGWNYHDGSFTTFVHEQTNGRGANLILDFIGAPYFADNIDSLAVDGKLVIIGMMGGTKVHDVDLGRLLARRLQIASTTLRSQSVANKIRLTQEFTAFALGKFANGTLKPVIDKVFPWTEAAAAHRYMAENRNIGKIMLQISS